MKMRNPIPVDSWGSKRESWILFNFLLMIAGVDVLAVWLWDDKFGIELMGFGLEWRW